MINYRQYQSDVIDEMIEHADDNCCALSCTGSGKSLMIRGFIEKLLELYPDETICVTVHVREILTNLKDTFKDLPVEFRTIQKLSRGKEYFDRIIIDETQHIPAKTYMKVIHNQCKAYFGFTALPLRGLIAEMPPNVPIAKDTWKFECTGLFSEDLFTNFAIGLSTKQAIEQGFLSDYKIIRDKDFHIEQVKGRLHDFTETEVNDALTVKECTEYVNDTIEDKKAIIFAHSIAFGEELAKRLGSKAEFLSSKSKPKEREAIFDKFKNGSLQILINVNLFVEGVDIPSTDAIYLFRPTRSLSVYFQSIGRGLRLAEGKEYCYVYDYVNNLGRLGTEPKDVQLEDTILEHKMCKESCAICGAYGATEGDSDKTVRAVNTPEGTKLKRILRSYYNYIDFIPIKGKKDRVMLGLKPNVFDIDEQLEIYDSLFYQDYYICYNLPVFQNRYGGWDIKRDEKAVSTRQAFSRVLIIKGKCKFTDSEHPQSIILKNYENSIKERVAVVK